MQNGCYQCLEYKLLFNSWTLTVHGMRYIYILTGNNWDPILFLFKIKSLKVADIIRGGLRRFSDSLGQLWNSLADFFIRSGHFEKVRHLFIPTLISGCKENEFLGVLFPYPLAWLQNWLPVALCHWTGLSFHIEFIPLMFICCEYIRYWCGVFFGRVHSLGASLHPCV